MLTPNKSLAKALAIATLGWFLIVMVMMTLAPWTEAQQRNYGIDLKGTFEGQSASKFTVRFGTGAPSSGDCDAADERGNLWVRTGDPSTTPTRVSVCFQTGASSYGWFPIGFKTGTSLPAKCDVGELFFKTDATAGQNLYLCTASDTWTQLVGGGGGGATSVSGLTDLKVTNSGSNLIVAAGNQICNDTVYVVSPVTITWVSGTADDNTVFYNCDAAGTANAIVIYTTNTVSGSGFLSTTTALINFPHKRLLATAGVTGSNWDLPVDLRGLAPVSAIVESTGISCDTNSFGLQRCGVGPEVMLTGSEYPYHFLVSGSGTGGAITTSDDQPTVMWNRLTGSNYTLASVACEVDAGVTTIQLQRDDGTPANILTGNLTCNGVSTSAFVSGENIIAPASRVDFQTVTTDGSAHWVAVAIVYSR